MFMQEHIEVFKPPLYNVLTVKMSLQLFSLVPAGIRSLGMGWRLVTCKLVIQNLFKVVKI